MNDADFLSLVLGGGGEGGLSEWMEVKAIVMATTAVFLSSFFGGGFCVGWS